MVIPRPSGAYTQVQRDWLNSIIPFFWEKDEGTGCGMALIWCRNTRPKAAEWAPEILLTCSIKINGLFNVEQIYLKQMFYYQETFVTLLEADAHLYGWEAEIRDLCDILYRQKHSPLKLLCFLGQLLSPLPAYKNLPHHSGRTPIKANRLSIRPRILDLYTRWQVNCHTAAWEKVTTGVAATLGNRWKNQHRPKQRWDGSDGKCRLSMFLGKTQNILRRECQ